MKIICQLIELSTGRRSETMTATREEFAQHLRDTEIQTDAGVLVLMEHGGDGCEWEFSHAPFMNVQTFCNYFG